MNLQQKLLEIQKDVDNFTKDKKGFNYTYTTGNQVLSKIRPKMNELGILLKQEVLSVHNERIDYVTGSAGKEKNKSEVLSSVAQRFTWIDCESNEREECLWHGNGMNDWDKGLGSALTYAERYFLLKFFHVPTDEDDNDVRQDNAGYVKQEDDNKKWLDETDKKAWMNAEEAVKSGKIKPRELRNHYKVSKLNMEYFESLIK